MKKVKIMIGDKAPKELKTKKETIPTNSILERKNLFLSVKLNKEMKHIKISDKQIFGYEIYLGYTYYIGSQKLPEPLLELPEHYCEIDAPEEYKDMLY